MPAENLLGEEGDGFKIAMATLDFTRPGTAIGAVGVAQAAYEHADRAGLPADDIFPVAETVLIRPDPVAATA